MPPESLPFDRKDFLKGRKPSSSDPEGIVPSRWREIATTSSQHNKHVFSPSCRWDGGGGPSDFRSPFSGHHSKRVAGGWHNTTVESGNKENNINTSSVSMASPNGNSHPHYDFVNSSDHHPKNNSGGGVSTTSSQRLEKEKSLGSSLDWKPLKWIRSGSLSSRGSGFSHQSSCKIIGMDPLDTKLDAQASGDVGLCVTPRTPDDVTSCKKPRLGWGEGLAKYEKKKVDTVDGVSGSEPLMTSPSNLSDRSPSVNGYPECASPTTPYSFACSSSPGVEEKESTKTVTLDNDTRNPSTEGLSINLENLLSSSSLDVLLQTVDSDKLQVWKAEITRRLEITETEIDSLENELKSLVSDKTSEETSMPLPDSSLEELTKVKHSDTTSSECSENLGSDDDGSELSTGNDSTDSDGGVVHFVRLDKLCDLILSTNKVIASKACDELSRMLLPTTHLCTNMLKATNESLFKKKFATRKRFLKFKERVITSKFRALHYSWKEDLHLLSSKRFCVKSHKKSESSSRVSFHSRLSSSGGSLSSETHDYVQKVLSDSRVRVHRSTMKMPCMILDRSERMMTRFISDNGLVENPVEVEKERSVVNSWTEEETSTFLEKYSQFGKDFKKIASFLVCKTVADCVEFYYKNHKSERFQTAKELSAFAKRDKCCGTSNTYLMTSGKRLNLEGAGASSLEMLGAASAMVANVENGMQKQQKPRLSYYKSPVLNDYGNEQETAAADVLAGICGSVSSDALGSCITTSVDHADNSKRLLMNDVDEESESCGEEVDASSSYWNDEEKSSFIKAFKCYGKDFSMISRCMGTRSSDECKMFYSKGRKCLGLDLIDVEVEVEVEGGSEEGGGSDGIEVENKGQVEGGDDSEAAPENTYPGGVTDEDSSASDPKDEGMNGNVSSEKVTGNGLLMCNSVIEEEDMKKKKKKSVVSQDEHVSSNRLSFRKGCENKLKLDESLLMDACLPRDLISDASVSQQPDVEKPSRRSNGDVKLFGQILTKRPQEVDRKVDESYSSLRSYGFWDGSRIQTIPDSARLLAKYPAAFSKPSTTFLKFDQNQHNGYGYGGGVQPPFTIDKLLSPGMSSSLQRHGVMKGVSVSDPVAAIRMHYAISEEYKYNNGNNNR